MPRNELFKRARSKAEKAWRKQSEHFPADFGKQVFNLFSRGERDPEFPKTAFDTALMKILSMEAGRHLNHYQMAKRLSESVVYHASIRQYQSVRMEEKKKPTQDFRSRYVLDARMIAVGMLLGRQQITSELQAAGVLPSQETVQTPQSEGTGHISENDAR